MDNDELFVKACESGNIDMVKFIIKYCEDNNSKIHLNDFNKYNILITLCCNGHLGLLIFLLNYYNENNINVDITQQNDWLFVLTCKYGQLRIIKFLLKNYKININTEYDKAFMEACESENIDLVKYLVEYGEKYNCKINIQNCPQNVFELTCNKFNTNNTLFDYLLYLNKHNYGKLNIINNIYFNESGLKLFNKKYISNQDSIYIYNNNKRIINTRNKVYHTIKSTDYIVVIFLNI